MFSIWKGAQIKTKHETWNVPIIGTLQFSFVCLTTTTKS